MDEKRDETANADHSHSEHDGVNNTKRQTENTSESSKKRKKQYSIENLAAEIKEEVKQIIALTNNQNLAVMDEIVKDHNNSKLEMALLMKNEYLKQAEIMESIKTNNEKFRGAIAELINILSMEITRYNIRITDATASYEAHMKELRSLNIKMMEAMCNTEKLQRNMAENQESIRKNMLTLLSR
jgi:hypothetical protein